MAALAVPLPRSVRLAAVPAVVGATGLAVMSGQALGGGSKAAVVLPLAVGAGLVLCLLALSRFHTYLFVTLALRSSLDVVKLSSADGGTSRVLDPATIVVVIFLMAGLLWLGAQYRAKGCLPGSRLRGALLAFLAATVLSVVGSGNVSSSLLEALRISSVVMMFVVVEQVCVNVQQMKRVLAAVYLSTLVPLALGLVGFLSGNARAEEKGGFTRILGTFNQSNEFGRYLMLMIIMGVAIYPSVERRFRPALAGILAVASLALVPTYTRTALLATAIGLVVVGLVHNKRVVLGVLATAGLAMLFIPTLSARFTDLSSSGSGYSPNAETSVAWRFDYWGDILPLASDNPLTGIGLAQTARVTENQQPPHNDFLRAYVETGVLGLIAYLGVLATLVWTGRRALAAAPPGTLDRGVAAGFLGCAVAFIAVSTVANLFSNVVTLWYFATFAAMAAAVLRRRTVGEAYALENS
jgi:putative inorganic carbon (hco3(-)) transporter